MPIQQSISARFDQLGAWRAAVQRGAPEAVIQGHENGRNQNRSIAAWVSDVSHANQAVIRGYAKS